LELESLRVHSAHEKLLTNNVGIDFSAEKIYLFSKEEQKNNNKAKKKAKKRRSLHKKPRLPFI